MAIAFTCSVSCEQVAYAVEAKDNLGELLNALAEAYGYRSNDPLILGGEAQLSSQAIVMLNMLIERSVR